MCTASIKMAVKLKKLVSKLLTEEARHVGWWSRNNARHVRQWTHGMFAREHVSSQRTLIREYISTEEMLTREARKYSRHVGTWAREHTKHVGTWARKHARHVGTWTRKLARHVGLWFMSSLARFGLSILEISKTIMYEFWYDNLKPKYGEKAKLCYMDKHSFIVYIRQIRRHCKRCWNKILYFRVRIRQTIT